MEELKSDIREAGGVQSEIKRGQIVLNRIHVCINVYTHPHACAGTKILHIYVNTYIIAASEHFIALLIESLSLITN